MKQTTPATEHNRQQIQRGAQHPIHSTAAELFPGNAFIQFSLILVVSLLGASLELARKSNFPRNAIAECVCGALQHLLTHHLPVNGASAASIVSKSINRISYQRLHFHFIGTACE